MGTNAGRENSQAREVRELLNGEAESAADGFHCETKTRILFVPHTLAADAAAALLICRQSGLLKKKLDAMDCGAADVLYGLTLATALPEN